jgi:hypothetical protein
MNLDREAPPCLFWFTTFHLNLMYSCIEEESRVEVIRRCYWPLLNLVDDCGVPLGVEASGLTLQIIESIDPSWVERIRDLIHRGKVEFIGSGYTQLIGPLVPAEVNAANLRFGHDVYEHLLDIRPRIALVNEQAYSSGMIEHYLNAGYRGIIMEWQNPAHMHPEWDSEWRYLPQWACDQQGNKIPLIWNNSIAFQKFQRLAHGEIDLDDYLDFIEGQVGSASRALSVYGNDVEIFDFRPGRYATEACLKDGSEWSLVRSLFNRLGSDSRFRAIRPREVLALMTAPGGGNHLQLESSTQPVPVKKQDKYNLTRWSVTGRDNLSINTRCWRIYQTLREKTQKCKGEWQELCYLWSSDFRTHITERRWRGYRERLAAFEKKLGSDAGKHTVTSTVNSGRACEYSLKTEKDDRYLIVESSAALLRLNQRRGLAIDALWFRDVSDAPLIGTLPHGFYDDISLAADFYTGHLTFEIPGQPKVTDLNPVRPQFHRGESWLEISADVPTSLGRVRKTYWLFNDGRLQLEWRLDWERCPSGSLRLGHVTLNPQAFKRDALYFRTQNGGYSEETFSLNRKEIDHGAPVSSLVSANCGLALTGGWIELGDKEKSVRLEVDQGLAALLAMVQYKVVGSSYFCRVSFSAQEMDETRNLQTRNAEFPAFLAMRFLFSAQESCRTGRNLIQRAKEEKENLCDSIEAQAGRS